MNKETEHPVPEGSFKTLLLVGEDPQLLTEEIPFLENHGYRVVRTGAEAQAEAQVRRGVPDLVLVDLEPGRESDGTWTAWRLLQESPTALLFRVDPHGAPEVLERTEAVNPCGYVRRGDGAAMLLVSLRKAWELFRADRERGKDFFRGGVLSDATFFRRSLSGVCLLEFFADGDRGTGDLVFLDVNPAFERQTGLERSALLGHPVSEVLADLAWKEVLDRFVQGDREETPYRCEHFFAEVRRYFHVTVYPVGGRRLVVVCDDITDRKLREQELVLSHLRLTSVLRGTGAGSWEWNVQTGETVYNETWASLLGYELRDLGPTSHETWKRLLHPEDEPESSRLLARHIAGELPFYDCQFRMRHRDGHWIWIRDRGQVVTWTEDGKPLLMYGTHMDITSLKEVEEALRKSEESYRRLADDMPLFVCRLSSEGTPGYVNTLLAERCRHEGVPPPEGAGAPELPEAMGTLMKGHLATLAPERPATIYEELWKDGGGARWVLWTVRAFFDGAGHVTHFQAVGTDITERQRAREALQEMKEHHEGIVQSMSDGVLLTDAEGKITFLNPEFAALVGEAPEALLGGLWLDVVLPAQRAVAEEADQRRARGQADRYELVLQRRDGTCRTVLVGGSARYEPATGAYLGTLGIFTDITERQRAEAQIRRLLEEKELILKEAHHRMKNHMNTMSSLLSLQAQTLDDPKAVQALEDARGRLESMAVLYDKLYRCGAPRAMPLGNYLPELVRWVVGLFPLGSRVTVETEIDEVVLSPRILSTLGILVNELVSNAMKYAFSGRSDGVLRVTASHRDGRVELTVEDDGPGFPPALDPACPSGFGLRLVALLATQLEGTLAVRSGKGAHISLDFPVE